ncbi:hypothetical protein [Cellulomonas endophytica]|uniref:hypothetical protein n=1 Tax=Cellulomonas endophytica TaxID=2494735 RepID=UPI001012E2E5|nr:hypothetical protein [Cellulomonas endophytica]
MPDAPPPVPAYAPPLPTARRRAADERLLTLGPLAQALLAGHRAVLADLGDGATDADALADLFDRTQARWLGHGDRGDATVLLDAFAVALGDLVVRHAARHGVALRWAVLVDGYGSGDEVPPLDEGTLPEGPTLAPVVLPPVVVADVAGEVVVPLLSVLEDAWGRAPEAWLADAAVRLAVTAVRLRPARAAG